MTLDNELIEETERASRVLHLRNLTGLSRRKFQEKYGVSTGTLQHWESVKPGISINGAKRLAKALAPEIHVSPEWILHGIGNQPIKEWHKTASLPQDSLANNEMVSIREQLDVFKKHHKHAIEHIINDDSMAPFYKPGDVVAGTRFSGEAIYKAVDKECIVVTDAGQTLLRHLKKGKTLNTFTLMATNPHTAVVEVAMQDIHLLSAAPVMLILRYQDQT